MLTVVAWIGTAASFAVDPHAIDLVALLSSSFDEEGTSQDVSATAGSCDAGCGLDACDLGCRCPRWTVETGAIFLHRSVPPKRSIVVDADTGEDIVNATDMALDWATGMYINVIRDLPCDWEFQVRYFNVDGWNSEQKVREPGRLVVPFWNRWPGDDVYAFDEMHGFYGSQLHSLEFNFRRVWRYKSVPTMAGGSCGDCGDCSCCRVPCVTLLAGYRWLDIHEHSRFWSSYTINDFDPYQWGTFDVYNSFHGFQVGADVSLFNHGGPLEIDAAFRAGIFGLRAHRAGFSTGDLGDRAIGDKEDHVSFLGEATVKAKYRLCCFGGLKSAGCGTGDCGTGGCGGEKSCYCISAFAAYEFLWLDGMVIATQQKPVDPADPVFHHGLIVGIESQW